MINRNIVGIKHLIESLLNRVHYLFSFVDSDKWVVESRHAIQELDGHLVNDVQVVIKFLLLDLLGEIFLLLGV